MKHTSGPWIFGPNAHLYADTTLKECLRVCNPRINKTTAITWDESDARLIAAAPDLLMALENLLKVVGVRIDDPRIKQFDAARAAINKATGE